MLFAAIDYLENGELDVTRSVDSSALDSSTIEHFAAELKLLTGDLELPFESRFPGPVDHCEYRIGSDLRGGAYCMCYFHDELIRASLMLQGVNEGPETDLLQVFKYLLLEPDDIDEEEGPTEEEIDSILSQEFFAFEKVEERPALYSVCYELEPDSPEADAHVESMMHHLAAAYFAMPAHPVIGVGKSE